MKSKKHYSIAFVLALLVYGISFIATKKTQGIEPCNDSLLSWYSRDTSLSNHSFLGSLSSDTLVIYSDSVNSINWNATTDSLCKIYSFNCSNVNKPILVVNVLDTVRINWNTRFGKKIYFKRCP